ncbi:hypothetical protein MLD38_018865 [Melastoma candidum]|uniref:Uncharacterized protein n=1 Tax=Melastoma candidum TaxID=119954 RepID=A0ACB9QV34_9MYRT|nr:hypothetical protein MLD38_018865 [Melastoma candidum]
MKLLKSLLHNRGRSIPAFRDRNGLTALHAAANKGYGEVHLLIEAGIPIDAQDNDGHTPLHLLAGHGGHGNGPGRQEGRHQRQKQGRCVSPGHGSNITQTPSAV